MLNGLQSVTVAAPVDWQMQMAGKNLKARSNSTCLQPGAGAGAGGMWRHVAARAIAAFAKLAVEVKCAAQRSA